MVSRRTINQSILTGMAMALSLNQHGNANALQNAGAQGFYLPDETLPHARTFMQWPVSIKVHPDRYFLKELQQAVANIANTLANFEPVVMLMDKSHQVRARQILNSKIEIWDIATQDLWCRDSGPIFVKNQQGKLAISRINFNGWGNKQIHQRDAKISTEIAERLGLPIFDNGLVGEGGGVESDGAGTLLAHESSWVNDNRNEGSREAIGKLLVQALGAKKVIWAQGIKGEDITDYHIDALARFVRPGLVAIQLPERRDPNDLWSLAAYQTYDLLKNSRDASGQKIEFEIITEPHNPRIVSEDFVASYVNYYACNGAVICAQFGDEKADRSAQVKLKKLYPDREIIALNIDAIGEVGGGIHCATQQQPE